MKTLEQVLELLGTQVERSRVECFIERTWVKPVRHPEGHMFEEIDIARIQLICQMQEDLMINDDAMDVILSLLDQLYSTRQRMQTLKMAIERLPEQSRYELLALLNKSTLES